jgi:hypothetical protein
MVDVLDLGSSFCQFESGRGQMVYGWRCRGLRSLGEMVDAAALKAAPIRGIGSSPIASTA